MIGVTFTPEQWTDVERIGACVVPGESDSEIFTASDGQPAIRITTNPPEQFRVANEPCQTCDGTGRKDLHRRPHPGFGHIDYFNPCPVCIGGKPVVELRVLCRGCSGRGEFWYDEDTPGAGQIGAHWAKCTSHGWRSHYCNGAGFVVVARATVTLLPVVRFIQQAPSPVLMGWHWVPDTYYAREFKENGTQEWWIHRDDGCELWRVDGEIPQFDPLPVAGRDCVAVFRMVET